MAYGANDETFYYYENRLLKKEQGANVNELIKERSYNKTLEHMHMHATFDQKMFDLGQEWFVRGCSLEEADDNCKNVPSFIVGFNAAKRRQLISKMEEENNLYNAGASWFKDGFSLKDADKKNNEAFRKGFIDTAFRIGYDYGYNKKELNNLNVNCLKNPYFLAGYMEGSKKEKDREERRNKYR